MHLELLITEGRQAGRHLPLGRMPVSFGRSIGATFSFPEDNFISGMHLTVQAALNCVVLIDMRSSNGTFLNNERIKQALALPGDVVKIGNLKMRIAAVKEPMAVRDEPPPPEPAAAEATVTPVATMLVIETMPEPVAQPIAEASAEPSAELSTEPVAGLLAEPIEQHDEHGHHPALDILRKPGRPLFCLLDASAHKTLPSLLSLAPDWKESLYDGDSANVLTQWAPYVVELEPDSALLDILVERGWGKGWASFFTSDASIGDLATHFRKFFMVQVEGGKEISFRFYDPRVLRELLPAASAEEVTAFFGPVTEWMIEAGEGPALLKIGNAGEGLRTVTVPLTETQNAG